MLERYHPDNWPVSWEGLVHAGVALAAAFLIAFLVHWVVFNVLRRVVRLSPSQIDDTIMDQVRVPTRWLLVGFAISVAAANDVLVGPGWDTAARFVIPVLVAWVAFRAVKGLEIGLEGTDFGGDPVAARSHQTRIAILSRTARVAILIIAISLVLLAIPGVREVGVTLMASAGLAALAIGAAAQPALKSLIAGLQVAISQPVRIGDLVKLDGQVGRIEEIRMSYITVRTWDERAIIVPTSRFLEESFENWSRVSEALTGPVFLHLDPVTDIEPIREEFVRFVQGHELWDGRTADALMTEAYPESVEVRLAVSSATIGDLWTLRCAVREHMLKWLRENMSGALIRHRLEVEAANERAMKG